jgi:deoxyguanosine kinase
MTYVAIEGPTGVGKTTLSKCLKERLGWKLLLDPYEANPFISRYYEEMPSAEWTPLLVEATFMFLRLAQLRDAQDWARSGLITDYAFMRTRLYAELLPDSRDGDRLKQMLDSWAGDVPAPDVLIVLSASFETLRSRIRRRARSIEKALSDDHIRDLRRLYDALRHRQPRPVIVETDAWDPRRSTDLDSFLERVGL